MGNSVNLLEGKKIDAKEFAEILSNLPEKEKVKIFYMVKGIELVSEPARTVNAVGL